MTITKDMTNSSLSDIFEYCRNHLLSQKEKCINEQDTCLYRHNGLMCAAGPLISDEKYSEEMECIKFIDVNASFNLGYSKEQVKLISKLQIIHDKFVPQDWELLLRFMAIDCRY